jgi:hypothetical protein
LATLVQSLALYHATQLELAENQMKDPNPAAWSNSDRVSHQASNKKKQGVTERSTMHRGYHQSNFFRWWLRKKSYIHVNNSKPL